MRLLMNLSCRAVKQPVNRDRYVLIRPASVAQSPQSVTCQVWPERVVATGPSLQPTAVTGELSGDFQTATWRA